MIQDSISYFSRSYILPFIENNNVVWSPLSTIFINTLLTPNIFIDALIYVLRV